MLFLLANLLFAIAGGGFAAVSGSVPGVIAWGCLVLGGLTIASRSLAWVTGTTGRAYAMAENDPNPEFGRRWRNRMMLMECGVWAIAIINVGYFVVFHR